MSYRLKGAIVALVMTVVTIGWVSLALTGGLGEHAGGDTLYSRLYPTLDPTMYPGYREAQPLALWDIYLNVPLFNQCDGAWYNKEMLGTCSLPRTLCDKGCALTSTAMTFKFYGATKNPDELNTCLGTSACPIYWGVAANNCSENKARYVGKYSFSYALLALVLDDGCPPIVQFLKPGREHWAVVRSVYGDGLSPYDYYINDPNGGVVRNFSYYTLNGWTPSKVVVFARR